MVIMLSSLQEYSLNSMKPRLLVSIFLIPILSWIPTSNGHSCDICPPGGTTKCEPPSPPRGGFISCKDTNNLTMNCVGTCLAGYVFPDGKTKMILMCNGKTGIWQPQRTFSNCVNEDSVGGSTGEYNQQQHQRPERISEPAACPELPSPSNAYVSCRYHGSQRKCYGRCNSGYVFALGQERTQTMTLECLQSGMWYPYQRFPDCMRDEGDKNGMRPSTDKLDKIREICQSPTAPVGGEIHCNYDSTKMTCKAKCYAGYTFPDGQIALETSCYANSGNWYPYPVIPECRRDHGGSSGSQTTTDDLAWILERCRSPDAPTGGEINCKYDTTQMTCKATCRTGYYFPGRQSLLQTRCYAVNGQWQPYTTFPNCRRDGGSHDVSGTTTDESEYIFQRCKRPDAPINGAVACQYDSTQMTCKATCHLGHVFPGRQTELKTRCLVEEGFWRPYTKFPHCRKDGDTTSRPRPTTDQFGLIHERCQIPSAPTDGEINCEYDSSQKTCTATCKAGYTFPGRHTMLKSQCFAETGYWSSHTTFPNCIRDDGGQGGSGTTTDGLDHVRERCISPSAPISGQIRCTYDSTQMTCKATCREGYTFPGRQAELATVCYAQNGNWYPYTTFPDCRREGSSTDDGEYRETRERCGFTPAPANGKYDCTYNSTNMECKGECKNGYSFPDGSKEKRASCHTETGYWYPYRTFPDCEADHMRYCPNRDPPANGRVDCYSDAEERKCVGRCYNGYLFPGGRSEMTLKCSATSGRWYPITYFPRCEPIDGGEGTPDSSLDDTLRNCRQPQAPSAGHINCNYDTRGMRCVAKCYEGYTFPSGQTELTVQCSTNEGTWYPFEEFPRCERTGAHTCQVCSEQEGNNDAGLVATLTRCRSPSSPIPGEINCQYDYKGMNCTGTCRNGYYFPDSTAEKILTCVTREGVWYPYSSFPECTKHGETYPTQKLTRDQILEINRRCPQPASPSLGHIVCHYGAEGVSCTGTCQEGYYFPDGKRETILRCETSRGVWRPHAEFPQCLSSGIRFCRSCTVNEASGQPDYAATLTNCRRPESPTPGKIVCFYDPSGMNCTARCDEGYYFPDRTKEKTVRCLTANGIWHPTSFPTCQRGHEDIETGDDEFQETLRRCRRPSPPSAGGLSCDYDREGMYCTGVCSLGFRFPGGAADMTLNCSTREGFWRPYSRFPNCEQGEVPCRYNCHQREEYVAYDVAATLQRCKRPSTPMFGRSVCAYDHLGMNCTATCKDGYYFQDGTRQKITQCLTTAGTWYPLQSYPSCVRYGIDSSHNQVGTIRDSRCSHPTVPVPGWVSCTHNSTTVTCRGECYDGYVFPGRRSKMTLECRINHGVWYPAASFPQCEPAESYGHQQGQQEHQTGSSDGHPATLSRCRPPLSPIPGEASCRYNSRGMNCTARCNEGYKFENGEGEITTRCLTVQGTWYPLDTYPKCVGQTYDTNVEIESERLELQREEELLAAVLTNCRVPANPTLGRLTCSYNRNGMNCTGNCRKGHYFPDGSNSMNLYCYGDRGYWSPSERFLECTAQDEGPHATPLPPPGNLQENPLQRTLRVCRRPEGPSNGYVLCKHNDVGRNCTGWCNYRYRFPDGRKKISIRCMTENGVWRPISGFPDCYEQSGRPGTTDQPDTEEERKQRLEEITRKCLRPLSPSPGNISCDFDNNGMTCIGLCAPGYKFTDGRSEITLRCRPESGSWHPLPIFPQCIVGTNTCKRPLTPANGRMTCANTSRMMTCTVKCNEGYSFLSGRDSMATRCTFEDGTWYPIQDFPECIRTDQISQENPDRNEEGNEKELDRMCPKPGTPKGGYIDCIITGNVRKCTGTCPTGYVFPNGRAYNVLRCSSVGSWTPAHYFPDCITEERYREGRQQHNGTSDGSGRITGGLCRRLESPTSGYSYCVYNSNMMECTGKCGPGYRFPSRESQLIRTCDQATGRWSPSEVFPDCEPICSSPCRNGGSCVRPDRCSCHYDFRGNYCEYPLSNCDPHKLEFAGAIQCNHTATETVCEIGCPRGTKLNYPYSIVRCSLDGTWTPRFSFRCVEDPTTSIPVTEPCPESRCGAELTEGPCQRPPTPNPGKIRCVYNSLLMECTGTCQDGYRFPDGTQEKIITCDKRNGLWSPVHQFPKCEPKCDRGCQNGGRCIAANLCYCPMEYRGDYCQYPLSNCDPNRLRFAGGAKCSHSSKDTVCILECPEGTVLDRPQYATVRCSLEGVWSPSIMPRCVEDSNYVSTLLEQNRQSRMRYESQYRHSEVSRTEAESVDEESREQTGSARTNRPSMYDKQLKDKNNQRYEQGHQSRSARLEQEDSDLYQRPYGGENRGTVSHERDEFNTGEGRFRHYDDFLRGAGGKEDYEIRQGREHHRSSSRQSSETQEHKRQYYQQRIKKKTETYSEHSSHSEHQYSRYHKEHGHGGQSLCSLCSP